MEILSSKFHTAKKDHVCQFCFGKIKVGEKYHYTSQKDNEFFVWKSHIRCDEIAEKLNMWEDGYNDGVTGEDFHEYINLSCQDIVEPEIYKELTFQERLERVCEKHLKTE